MKDLIEALTILSKYTDAFYATACEHDVLYVPTVDHESVSKEDKIRLKELGFDVDYVHKGFKSYRFGSC